jgi:S-DNA-T family DNA segregation ATPase FtsK/SpoIIIE
VKDGADAAKPVPLAPDDAGIGSVRAPPEVMAETMADHSGSASAVPLSPRTEPAAPAPPVGSAAGPRQRPLVAGMAKTDPPLWPPRIPSALALGPPPRRLALPPPKTPALNAPSSRRAPQPPPAAHPAPAPPVCGAANPVPAARLVGGAGLAAMAAQPTPPSPTAPPGPGDGGTPAAKPWQPPREHPAGAGLRPLATPSPAARPRPQHLNPTWPAAHGPASATPLSAAAPVAVASVPLGRGAWPAAPAPPEEAARLTADEAVKETVRPQAASELGLAAAAPVGQPAPAKPLSAAAPVAVASVPLDRGAWPAAPAPPEEVARPTAHEAVKETVRPQAASELGLAAAPPPVGQPAPAGPTRAPPLGPTPAGLTEHSAQTREAALRLATVVAPPAPRASPAPPPSPEARAPTPSPTPRPALGSASAAPATSAPDRTLARPLPVPVFQPLPRREPAAPTSASAMPVWEEVPARRRCGGRPMASVRRCARCSGGR